MHKCKHTHMHTHTHFPRTGLTHTAKRTALTLNRLCTPAPSRLPLGNPLLSPFPSFPLSLFPSFPPALFTPPPTSTPTPKMVRVRAFPPSPLPLPPLPCPPPPQSLIHSPPSVPCHEGPAHPQLHTCILYIFMAKRMLFHSEIGFLHSENCFLLSRQIMAVQHKHVKICSSVTVGTDE